MSNFHICSPIPGPVFAPLSCMNGTSFMQLRGGGGGGANKNVQQNTAPLLHVVRSNGPCTTAYLHEAVRGYNLKRWISIVDSLVYSSFQFRSIRTSACSGMRTAYCASRLATCTVHGPELEVQSCQSVKFQTASHQ